MSRPLRTVARITKMMVAALSIVPVLLVVDMQPALAAEIGTGWYQIRSQGDGRCLDHYADAPAPRHGNWVGLFHCTGGSTQRWQVLRTGTSSHPYQIFNGRSGECLIFGGFHYTATPRANCATGDSLIRATFMIQSTRNGVGWYIVYTNDPVGDNDTLVDVHQSTYYGDGSPIGNFRFNDSGWQRWTFVPA